jgi:hypothetical protein
MKKVISILMLSLILVHISFTNQAAIGSYKKVDNAPASSTALATGAVPAVVAVVAVGVIAVSAVAAFAYGVYTGYREAAAAAEASILQELEEIDYSSSDFSKFDV